MGTDRPLFERTVLECWRAGEVRSPQALVVLRRFARDARAQLVCSTGAKLRNPATIPSTESGRASALFDELRSRRVRRGSVLSLVFRSERFPSLMPRTSKPSQTRSHRSAGRARHRDPQYYDEPYTQSACSRGMVTGCSRSSSSRTSVPLPRRTRDLRRSSDQNSHPRDRPALDLATSM